MGDSKIAEVSFKLFFLAFVVIGASIQLSSVVDLSDALVFVVAIPNLIGLYLVAPVNTNMVLAYLANHILKLPRSY